MPEGFGAPRRPPVLTDAFSPCCATTGASDPPGTSVLVGAAAPVGVSAGVGVEAGPGTGAGAGSGTDGGAPGPAPGPSPGFRSGGSGERAGGGPPVCLRSWALRAEDSFAFARAPRLA